MVVAGVFASSLKFANLILSFGLSVLLARYLGPEGFGRYSLVIGIIFILAIPTQLGVPNILLKELPIALSARKWERIQGIIDWSTTVTMRANFFIITIGIFGIALPLFLFGSRINNNYLTWFIGLFLIPFLSLINLRGAALRGISKLYQGLLPENLILPAFYIIILYVYAAIRPLTTTDTIGIYLISSITTYLISTLLLNNNLPTKRLSEALPSDFRSLLLKQSLAFALISGSGVITRYSDVIMIGLLRSDVEAGVYRVAAQWSNFIGMGTLISGMIFPQLFSKYYHSGDRISLKTSMIYSSALSSLIAGSIVLASVLFGKNLITVIFGDIYVQAYGLILILGVSQLINAGFGSTASITLNMTGFEATNVRIMTAAVLLNIALNLLFIPKFGGNGAAAATLLTVTFATCLFTKKAYTLIWK